MASHGTVPARYVSRRLGSELRFLPKRLGFSLVRVVRNLPSPLSGTIHPWTTRASRHVGPREIYQFSCQGSLGLPAHD